MYPKMEDYVPVQVTSVSVPGLAACIVSSPSVHSLNAMLEVSLPSLSTPPSGRIDHAANDRDTKGTLEAWYVISCKQILQQRKEQHVLVVPLFRQTQPGHSSL